MLPKCSLIIYIGINAFDYNAVIVYFTVLKPGTLYLAWYCPSYPENLGTHKSTQVRSIVNKHILQHTNMC